MATFYDRFVECSEKWPRNIAVEIQTAGGLESYSYADLRRMAESVAHRLLASGYKPGARCAILAANHPRWVAVYLGIIAAGCTAVPLDTAFIAEQVTKLLKDSGSSLLFHDQERRSTAKQAAESLKLAYTDLAEDFRPAPSDFHLAAVDSAELAALLYTSGTTADPKGVMLTHANLLGEADAVFGWAHIGPGDAVLGILPLFHSLAQMANLLLPLASGARVVYLETLNTTELLRALREREITAFACVPQFFYLIHERIAKEVAARGKISRIAIGVLKRCNRFTRAWGWNPGKMFFRPIHRMFGDKMRYLVTGGSRWDPQVGEEFYSLGIDILQAYGLTETSGGAFANPPEDIVIGSVGKPLPGVAAKIIDPQPQDSGPATGEVAIAGPIVMKGYWNRADATAQVLREGWLHTGDLGYFDAKGNLFITGRRKEIIVLSSGKNIYPEEIEAHYLNSPYIKEICVMGLVSAPGEPFAERLHAVVVPNFEVLKQRKIVNTKEVIRFDIEGLSQKLPSTKRILSYEIWQDDLPRTTTRKLKRFEIEKRVRENQKSGRHAELEAERPLTPQELAWLEEPVVMRALKILRESSKNKTQSIRPDANLELDLGLDSMQRVELLVAFEQELGGALDESRLSEIYTVRELVDAVRENASSGAGPRRAAAPGWPAIFADEVTDPGVLALHKDRMLSATMLFLKFRCIQVIARDLFRLKVTGLDKIPAKGPFIISPNHQSYIDPFLVSSVLPWAVFRNLFSVGTSEIFGSGLMRALARFLRVIVVDPDANLIPAMRAGAYGLRHGRVLMLFPEGERSIDGTPKVFKKGAAILSANLQVPIVPVSIRGAYEVWPRGKKFFQSAHPVSLSFGYPIYPPTTVHPGESDYTTLTAELRRRVVDMWSNPSAQTGQPNSRAAHL